MCPLKTVEDSSSVTCPFRSFSFVSALTYLYGRWYRGEIGGVEEDVNTAPVSRG